jgi:hypothetical protein
VSRLGGSCYPLLHGNRYYHSRERKNYYLSDIRMKTLTIISIWLLTLYSANAQKNCYYKIDTQKVMNCENLAYLVHKLETEKFTVGWDLSKLPLHVKKQLNCFDISFVRENPGVPDWIYVPHERKLYFYALNDDLFLLTYYKGHFGVGSAHILIMRFENKHLVDLFNGYKGSEYQPYFYNWRPINSELIVRKEYRFYRLIEVIQYLKGFIGKNTFDLTSNVIDL